MGLAPENDAGAKGRTKTTKGVTNVQDDTTYRKKKSRASRLLAQKEALEALLEDNQTKLGKTRENCPGAPSEGGGNFRTAIGNCFKEPKGRAWRVEEGKPMN